MTEFLFIKQYNVKINSPVEDKGTLLVVDILNIYK